MRWWWSEKLANGVRWKPQVGVYGQPRLLAVGGVRASLDSDSDSVASSIVVAVVAAVVAVAVGGQRWWKSSCCGGERESADREEGKDEIGMCLVDDPVRSCRTLTVVLGAIRSLVIMGPLPFKKIQCLSIRLVLSVSFVRRCSLLLLFVLCNLLEAIEHNKRR